MLSFNKLVLLNLFSFFILINIVQCLYFHIAETDRKCFIEEIPDETLVVGNYKCQLYDPQTGGYMASSPGIGMHVEVRDPDDKIILSKGLLF
jgi:glycoprotein 25l, putative